MARAATAPVRPRTAPAPRPAAPRRRSGATVRTRAPAKRRRTAPPIARVLEAPAARLLDTLLQGRAWIVLIGVLLTGIVFFNVSLLGLNQGITRNSERAQALQQQNAQLRLQVADLASSERIVNLATRKGMVMPAAGKVTYLRSHPRGDARRALALIEAPSPAPQPAPGTMAPGTAPVSMQPAPSGAVPSARSLAQQPTTAAPTP